MLSILIPTYNTEITDLVDVLYRQCQNLNIDFEILCYDDFSLKKYKDKNKIISNYDNVIYKEMNSNQGRAKLRNILANDAKFDTMLFLDADSEIVKENFISVYLSKRNYDVVSGGTVYSEVPPHDKNKILHWRYGKEKESKVVAKRIKNPFLSFMSNNFILSKKVFEKVQFDENHTGYGYEDTLFAYEIKKQGVMILHVDNPVKHLGIEDTDVFLKKTEEAIRNLIKLYKQEKLKDTTLILFYKKLKKLGVEKLFSKIVLSKKKSIIRNLHSTNPSLSLFQIYKLALFIDEILD